MGQAKRRRDAGEAPPPIKISPRKRMLGFRLAHHNRVEQQNEDGVIYALNFFTVVSDEGMTMMEETPDGPRPVIVASIPQPVRRSVVAAPAILRG